MSGHHGLLCKIGDDSDLEGWGSIYKCLPLVSASTFYLKLWLAECRVICGDPEQPTAREASIPNDHFSGQGGLVFKLAGKRQQDFWTSLCDSFSVPVQCYSPERACRRFVQTSSKCLKCSKCWWPHPLETMTPTTVGRQTNRISHYEYCWVLNSHFLQ